MIITKSTQSIILLSLLFFINDVNAQYKKYLKDENNPTIYINEIAGVERVQVIDEKPKKILLDRTYFWYKSNSVISTKGGADGKVLHGEYTKFYTNNNLKEKGFFVNGLKEGEWKEWNPEGNLKTVSHYKKGLLSGKRTTYLDSVTATTTYKNGKEVLPVIKQKRSAAIKGKDKSIKKTSSKAKLAPVPNKNSTKKATKAKPKPNTKPKDIIAPNKKVPEKKAPGPLQKKEKTIEMKP